MIFLQLYGNDHDHYNTVADTTIVPFWLIQTTRLLMCLVLISLTVIYTYIYFRAALS